MINHTLLFKFTETLADQELEQVLSSIENVIRATGVVDTVGARKAISVPGEEEIPAFIGTAIMQIGVADLAALGTLFGDPSVSEAFDALRERHPYTAAWANHEPLTS